MNLDLRCIISIVFVIRALNLTDSPDPLVHITCPCPLYAITTMHDVLCILLDLCTYIMKCVIIACWSISSIYTCTPYYTITTPAPSILFDVINIDPVTCRVIQTPPALVQSQECSRIIHCFISRTWYLAFYQTSGPFTVHRILCKYRLRAVYQLLNF